MKATPGRPLSILATLVSSFGVEYAWSSLLQLLDTLIQFTSPTFVNLLIG